MNRYDRAVTVKTPTHYVINHVLADRLGWAAPQRRAFALGGVAPDLPVIVIFSAILAVQVVTGGDVLGGTLSRFRSLYEGHALVIAAHSLLHAPLSLAFLYMLSLMRLSQGADLVRRFLAGAALHSFADLYTHVDDGPLLLWPFDWTRRFEGTISHWDVTAYGMICLVIEGVIVIAFVASRLARRHEGSTPYVLKP